MCVYIYRMHAGPWIVQKRVPGLLALELQVVVRPLLWILGMELRSLEEQEVSCLHPCVLVTFK